MSDNQFRLDGKVAIVTGGSRGIGKAACLALARAGADVVVCSRDIIACNIVSDAIQKLGKRSLSVAVDVTKLKEIDAMTVKAKDVFGKIDILVNGAGIGGVTRSNELSEDAWDKIVDLDLKGTFLCCQSVGKEMIEQNKGNIVNISSMMGSRAAYGHAAYGASKAGVDHLTRILAVEWSRYNIRVNSIAPGWVDTDMTKDIPDDIRKKLTERIPLKRFARPEEMTGAILYLASDLSTYMTGTVLHIDGGMTAIL